MTTLCSTNALEEGKSQAFKSHVGPVFAVKRDNVVFVYRNECPNLYINLSSEQNDPHQQTETAVQCSGRGTIQTIEMSCCLLGPCKGKALKPIQYRLQDNKIIIK